MKVIPKGPNYILIEFGEDGDLLALIEKDGKLAIIPNNGSITAISLPPKEDLYKFE